MSGKSLHRIVAPPRIALRRDEAAAALSISPTTFDEWVKERKLPAPHRIGRVVLWDMAELVDAWQLLIDASDGDTNPFDQVTA